MNAGKLDKLIKIMRPDGGVDDYGAPTDGMSELTKVWAQRVNKSAKEVQTGSEVQISHTLWRMWPTDINNSDEIHYDSIVYRVNAIVADDDEHIMVKTTAAI